MMRFMTLTHLRIIALMEGISYLLLLFIGMPLKYGFGIMMVNKVLGMGHGILTLIFCLTLFYLWQQKKIHTLLSIGVFMASLIPFGAFVADIKLVKLIQFTETL
ncbi:hypothetical protein DID74_00700 [Candidatus Marinamargulisbacteria bacterium SCGC AG-333-B06]|nr:hypothetical protein DID74_00700 [Candidatus Marinamargulisbacteria bacterium SCGC AG-333-B06]